MFREVIRRIVCVFDVVPETCHESNIKESIDLANCFLCLIISKQCYHKREGLSQVDHSKDIGVETGKREDELLDFWVFVGGGREVEEANHMSGTKEATKGHEEIEEYIKPKVDV